MWDKILEPVASVRKESEMLQLFPGYLKGEDLFGLTVSAVARIAESVSSPPQFLLDHPTCWLDTWGVQQKEAWKSKHFVTHVIKHIIICIFFFFLLFLQLPGVEACENYTFRYGRNPLMELPLAINPTGCARAEPKMSTHVKRFVLRYFVLISHSTAQGL